MPKSTLLAQAANLGGFDPVSPLYGRPVDEYGGDPAGSLTDLETMISTGIGVLTTVGAIFFIVYFFLAAFKWLTAGGDSGKVQKARDEMVQGALGLIVMVAAYGVIGLVGTIVGINILNPANAILNILGPVLP